MNRHTQEFCFIHRFSENIREPSNFRGTPPPPDPHLVDNRKLETPLKIEGFGGGGVQVTMSLGPSIERILQRTICFAREGRSSKRTPFATTTKRTRVKVTCMVYFHHIASQKGNHGSQANDQPRENLGHFHNFHTQMNEMTE